MVLKLVAVFQSSGIGFAIVTEGLVDGINITLCRVPVGAPYIDKNDAEYAGKSAGVKVIDDDADGP